MELYSPACRLWRIGILKCSHAARSRQRPSHRIGRSLTERFTKERLERRLLGERDLEVHSLAAQTWTWKQTYFQTSSVSDQSVVTPDSGKPQQPQVNKIAVSNEESGIPKPGDYHGSGRSNNHQEGNKTKQVSSGSSRK